LNSPLIRPGDNGWLSPNADAMTAESKKQLKKLSTRKLYFQVEQSTFVEGATVELLLAQ